MPATVDEVRQLIQEGFPDCTYDVTEEDHRIVGTINWDNFRGMDVRKRNQLVTDKVRNRLGYKSLNVGFLLPLAPGDKL